MKAKRSRITANELLSKATTLLSLPQQPDNTTLQLVASMNSREKMKHEQAAAELEFQKKKERRRQQHQKAGTFIGSTSTRSR